DQRTRPGKRHRSDPGRRACGRGPHRMVPGRHARPVSRSWRAGLVQPARRRLAGPHPHRRLRHKMKRPAASSTLTGMTMTTIKGRRATRARLHRLAAADGVTLAQEIDKLVSERALRPRPTTGGFRSNRPLSAEEIDELLADGFRR